MNFRHDNKGEESTCSKKRKLTRHFADSGKNSDIRKSSDTKTVAEILSATLMKKTKPDGVTTRDSIKHGLMDSIKKIKPLPQSRVQVLKLNSKTLSSLWHPDLGGHELLPPHASIVTAHPP